MAHDNETDQEKLVRHIKRCPSARIEKMIDNYILDELCDDLIKYGEPNNTRISSDKIKDMLEKNGWTIEEFKILRENTK